MKKSKIVEHSLTRHAMKTIKATEKKSQTMICKGCGAKIEVAATSTDHQLSLLRFQAMYWRISRRDAIIPGRCTALPD